MEWSGADRGAVVAGAVAAVLVLGAVVWWAVERRRVRRAVGRGLRDPDPAVRAAVVTAITGQGVRTYARRLLVLAAGEDDPEVRRTLAAAVVRSQWEPVTDPRLLALRIWADGVTTGSDGAAAVATAGAAAPARSDGVEPLGATVLPPGPERDLPDRTRPDAVAPVG